MDLTVKNLSKQFVDFKLDNISFELPRGSVMGLIGPNGSGKTTTIKLILNMLKKNQVKKLQNRMKTAAPSVKITYKKKITVRF